MIAPASNDRSVHIRIIQPLVCQPHWHHGRCPCQTGTSISSTYVPAFATSVVLGTSRRLGRQVKVLQAAAANQRLELEDALAFLAGIFLRQQGREQIKLASLSKALKKHFPNVSAKVGNIRKFLQHHSEIFEMSIDLDTDRLMVQLKSLDEARRQDLFERSLAYSSQIEELDGIIQGRRAQSVAAAYDPALILAGFLLTQDNMQCDAAMLLRVLERHFWELYSSISKPDTFFKHHSETFVLAKGPKERYQVRLVTFGGSKRQEILANTAMYSSQVERLKKLMEVDYTIPEIGTHATIFFAGYLLRLEDEQCEYARLNRATKRNLFPEAVRWGWSSFVKAMNGKSKSFFKSHSDLFRLRTDPENETSVVRIAELDDDRKLEILIKSGPYVRKMEEILALRRTNDSNAKEADAACSHSRCLQKLLDAEWEAEQGQVLQRLNEWPQHRLEADGLIIMCVRAEDAGFKILGDPCVDFARLDGKPMPRHEFGPGDELLVSREHPLREEPLIARVISTSPGIIRCTMKAVPSAGGAWRLDRGANKIAYERSSDALARFASDRFNAKIVRQRLLNLPCDSSIPTLSLGDWSSTPLNARQVQAAIQIETNSVSLIQGPPGCGKTVTACMVLKKAYQGRPMLAVADSNVAADQLFQGLCTLGAQAVRIGCSTSMSGEFPQNSLNARLEQHPEHQRLCQLQQEATHLRSQAACEPSNSKRQQEARTRQAERWRLEERMLSDVLGEAEVICTTLVGCGAPVLSELQFDLILVDEASQATEPRALIALSKLSQKGRVVLIGDQQQLAPTCISQKAKDAGLGKSLFCRLVSQEALLPVMLDVQFRMHPLLRQWPSQTFYNGELCDGVDASERLPPPGLPWKAAGGLLFVESFGQEEPSLDGDSKMNRGECELVRQVMVCLRRAAVSVKDIGVISAYRGQAEELRKRLRAWPELEVKTIDGFQGREKPIIIFSCVRSNPDGQIGFLADHRRLNVALTRAQRGLVVIGNPLTLQQDGMWCQWLQFVKQHNLEIGLEELYIDQN